MMNKEENNAVPLSEVEPSPPKGMGNAVDSFMLEEYKNISKAHYELHNGFRQMFRFYLGIVAIPVTLFALAYKDMHVSLGALPPVIAIVLLLIAGIGFLMFLSLINIRFDIISIREPLMVRGTTS
jgi:ABC-type polysaccharide/polyol phosphate export permease